ncbi:MAG: RidA family protein [Erysipelotrichaceae bacterium]|nr:RidA family protein [Erysipelotrichaceae bacterium]
MKKILLVLVVLLTLVGCSSSKKVISTDKAPQAIGPYNQAIVHDDTIYCSGQIAIDPETNEFIGGDIVAQTNQVFKNIIALLDACGSDLSKVVKCNVFLKDINDFNTVNEIYASYFEGTDYPARSAVEVGNLPKGALIEIEVIAIK